MSQVLYGAKEHTVPSYNLILGSNSVPTYIKRSMQMFFAGLNMEDGKQNRKIKGSEKSEDGFMVKEAC